VILDAATLLTYFNSASPEHWSVSGNLELQAEMEELVVSPFVIAELEPMIRAGFGIKGWLAVLDELAGGAWTLAPIDAAHLGAMRNQLAAGASCAEASVAALSATS
jgi:hypothetical protein